MASWPCIFPENERLEGGSSQPKIRRRFLQNALWFVQQGYDTWNYGTGRCCVVLCCFFWEWTVEKSKVSPKIFVLNLYFETAKKPADYFRIGWECFLFEISLEIFSVNLVSLGFTLGPWFGWLQGLGFATVSNMKNSRRFQVACYVMFGSFWAQMGGAYREDRSTVPWPYPVSRVVGPLHGVILTTFSMGSSSKYCNCWIPWMDAKIPEVVPKNRQLYN